MDCRNCVLVLYQYLIHTPMKTTLKKPVAIVGYSGHAYVIIDIFLNAGRLVTAYCDSEEKKLNPYGFPKRISLTLPLSVLGFKCQAKSTVYQI